MQARPPRALLTLAIAVASATIALPRVAAAWNLLKNPEFTGSTDNWNPIGTSGAIVGYESFFGSPGNGSLRLQSQSMNATSHAAQCVDVSKWQVIDFSLRKLYDGESGTGTHSFRLETYDAANCGGNLLAGTIVLPDAGTAVDGNPVGLWVEVSVLGTPLPSGALSAKVVLDTNAGSSGMSYYIFDHIQVVPPDEIFPDDFETH